MTLIDRARGFIDRVAAQARPYRFEGEQENHARTLQETRTALSMMETADLSDPDQARMATDFEHGAEAQLAELLKKPRLTLEEKRTRDAIQAAIQKRRAGFGEAPVLVAREGGWRPQRLMGALTGNLAMYGALAAGVAMLGVWGWWRIEVAALKHQRDRGCLAAELQAGSSTTRRPCVDLGDTQRQLEHSRRALADATRMVREADTNAMRTAETLRRLEQQRAARAAQQRRTQRELEALRNGLGEPPELGLHDANPPATGDRQN